jgi:hypothetical protein
MTGCLPERLAYARDIGLPVKIDNY